MPIFTIHQKIKNPRKVLIYRDFLCFTILSSGETGFEPITLTAYVSATLLSKFQIGNETVTIFNR